MKKSIIFLTLLALLVVFSACQKDQNSYQSESNPLLQVNTLAELSGSNMEGGLLVTYSATTDDQDMVHLTTSINGKELEAFLSYERFAVRYDGHDNSLTRAELDALGNTSDKIAQTLFPELEEGSNINVNAVQSTVVTVLAHLSDAPENYPIGKNEIGGAEKTAINDFVKCVKKRDWYNIAFDDDGVLDRSPGKVISTRKQVDGDGGPLDLECIGRCGGRCGGWWVFWKTWSMDCFEHDWCYSYYRVGTGGTDSKCGDEWWQAVDDYTFGFITGCNGNRG